MKYILSFVILLTHCALHSQVTDDFNDGDFLTNPSWSGTDADYLVNGSFELQLNNTIADTSYLTIPHSLANLDNKEWNFRVRQAFSPSGSNYGRIYLTSSSADLTTDPDGFYLQFGEAGSLDAVRLFKVETGIHTELLAGPASQISASFNIGVRVVRDNTGLWELFIDDTGGTSYVLMGSVIDATNLLGTHFGMLAVYTASNAAKFYYDDIYIGDEILDLTPPSLISVAAINANQIDVYFSEAVDQTTAELATNYSYAPNGSSITATLDGVDPTLVHLIPSVALTNGETYTLTVTNVEDLSANAMISEAMQFSYFISEVAGIGDVIINEFMCDPSPPIGLPELEYIEIYNRSNKIFDLSGWKIGDASSNGTIQQDWLLPGEYRVLTATANVDSFLYSVAVTSFPSLNNAGDAIILRTDQGLNIDSISYTYDWYHDESKASGGYSIERINPEDPCTDINDWSASNDFTGGTPGAQNSVFDTVPDVIPPYIDQLVALAPSYLEVHFNEGIDTSSAINSFVSTDPSLTLVNTLITGENPSMITLQFGESFVPSEIYNITLQNIADCWQNIASLTGDFVLPDMIEPGDIVINEIMFNPITGGSDWVELYNNSEKIVDLFYTELANLNDTTFGNEELIEEHFLLYPERYVVISEDTSHILQNYVATPGRFIQSGLPTYSNDEGSVYFVSAGVVIDEVHYLEDWHFKLLDDLDGKSLERIRPEGPSSEESNWHTAAESEGFATPGRENSQYYPALSSGDFSYTSETVSPDNDGFEDVLQINYELNGNGFIGNFMVYDDRGRLIATVMKSELLSNEGTFSWKGITDNGSKASIGTYVGVFEAFDIDGGVIFTKRKAFVVAGNL